MARYNQQYSEIKDMPVRTVLFLLHLASAEDQYNEQKVKRAQNKNKGRKI